MKPLAAPLLALLLAASMPATGAPSDPPVLESPDGTLTVDVALTAEGQPRYRVRDGGAPVIAPSPLGFTFEDAPPMRDGFEVVGTATRSVDTAWTPVWGTQDRVVNRFNELTVELRETEAPQRRLTLVFRAYDDGVAFRYRWPEQPTLDSLRIASEDTHFRFTADHTSWWIPDDYDGYEWVYRQTALSAIVDSAAAVSYNSRTRTGTSRSTRPP
jgi:alpha-glucosidase